MACLLLCLRILCLLLRLGLGLRLGPNKVQQSLPLRHWTICLSWTGQPSWMRSKSLPLSVLVPEAYLLERSTFESDHRRTYVGKSSNLT